MQPRASVLLPAELLDLVPAGVAAQGFDPDPRTATALDQVRLLVPPYMPLAEHLEVIERMPALEVVQSLSVGYDDLRPYARAGLTICNARGVHEASTAELAVALVLASLRGLPDFVRNQATGSWVHERRPALADKTVLVVGMGNIGREIARRLEGFACVVTGVARTARPGVHAVTELDDLLPAADVVVLALPLQDATRHVLDGPRLGRLKDGALVVNVGRGPLLDTDALLAELRTGRLLAALDVTDPEPLPPDHELWRLPGVLISPHVGGDTSAFLPRARRLVQAQLSRWVAGEPLENVVLTGPA